MEKRLNNNHKPTSISIRMVNTKGRRRRYKFTSTVLTLLLVTFLSFAKDVSACPLCINGEEITKPDKRLGITSPLPLETCLDLSYAVSFLAEGSETCLQSRALSGLCGCPVPPAACTICDQGSNMTLPLQVLDGLVELDASGTSFGLDTTCELVESVIGLYEETSQLCLDLPFDKLRSYCACSTPGNEEIMTVENASTCNICAGGELLRDVSDSSFHYQDSFITCQDAVQLANSTVKGSDVCNLIQGAGTICGCPVRDDACELCQGGFLGNANDVVFVDDEVISCSVLEARLHLIDKSSQECSHAADMFSAECGCTAGVEFQPCTLCPLGESVRYPERNISGLDGLGSGFVEPNCAAIEQAAALYDVNSILCTTVKAIAKLCGCAGRPNACSICGAGNTMTKPHAKSSWAIGKTGVNILPALTVDVDYPFSCEIADSALSYWSDTDDNMCFYIHLTKGTSCGCEGPSQMKVKALVWTQQCVGLISLLGSSCIVYSILSRSKKTRWSMFHQMMFAISVFDSVSSFAFLLGSLPVPKSTAMYGARGNETTCKLQGWIFQVGQISMYYNVALSMYFLLVIKYDWKDRRFQVIKKYVHAGILCVGLSLAFASIPYHEPNYRWCYVAWPPIGATYTLGMVFFIVPVGMCILVITILTFLLVKHVNQVDAKTRAKSLSSKKSADSMASRTFWQSLWFLAAFYLVWPVLFATFILPLVPQNFWCFVIGSVLGPSQGFFNACIFFNRRREALKKKMFAIFCIKSKSTVSTPASSTVTVKYGNPNSIMSDIPSTSPQLSKEVVRATAKKKAIRVTELTPQGEEDGRSVQEMESARQESLMSMGATERSKRALLHNGEYCASLRIVDLVTMRESQGIRQQMESSSEEIVSLEDDMSSSVIEHAKLAGLMDVD